MLLVKSYYFFRSPLPAGVFILSLLLCGCQPSVDSSVEKRSELPTKVTAPVAQSIPSRDNKVPDQIAIRARMDELTNKIATAQAQQNDLRLKQTAVTAKLEAHQTDSTAELASLKSEMQALQRREAQAGAKGSAQFGEKARTQLEHALAMDQEYQAQLNELNEELQQQNKQMDAMRAELKGLQTGSGK